MGTLHNPSADGNADPWRICAQLATMHYENFTVGSRLLPRRLRRHFWAVYAYCRTVDDLGDEATGDRSALLDAWEAELEACFEGAPRHPVMQALQSTVHDFHLPKEPFLKLIEANRRDQRLHRYASYKELLEYCEYSANPVGHLVLGLLGASSPQARRLADATCSALQLTNFWQDVARDFAKGRIYIPQDDMRRFGYTEEDLAAGRVTDAFRSLLAFEIRRTRSLFDEGDALLALLPVRFRVEVALFSLGGRTVLDAIEAQGYDVLTHRPVVSSTQKARLGWRALGKYGPWRRLP